MDILMKCAAVAVVAAVLGLVIKKNNPETALLMSLGAAAVLLTTGFSVSGEMFDFLQELMSITGIPDGVVSVVLKTVAVAVITGVASDVCKDAGQGALSSACETVGALTAMYIALPLLKIVLETMEKLL